MYKSILFLLISFQFYSISTAKAQSESESVELGKGIFHSKLVWVHDYFFSMYFQQGDLLLGHYKVVKKTKNKIQEENPQINFLSSNLNLFNSNKNTSDEESNEHTKMEDKQIKMFTTFLLANKLIQSQGDSQIDCTGVNNSGEKLKDQVEIATVEFTRMLDKKIHFILDGIDLVETLDKNHINFTNDSVHHLYRYIIHRSLKDPQFLQSFTFYKDGQRLAHAPWLDQNGNLLSSFDKQITFQGSFDRDVSGKK
jgi:hypothetical protein